MVVLSPANRLARRLVIALVFSGLALWSTNGQPLLAQSTPQAPAANFDRETQALMAKADHVVFLIPFSHWDTDWHDTYSSYSQLADQNITQAIAVAKQYPRFRYTFEQVLFVQHFWEAHPEDRTDLNRFVQNRQFTFAWGGITQPETSLVAPAVQVRNLQLGQAWITQTFGAQYVPHTAWQSDAFGTSAAFPTFLSQSGVQYLFIGRWQGGCDPDYQQCRPLPPAFYWTSPAAPPGISGRVLTTYISYPTAWFDIYHRTDPDAQISELRKTTDAEFKMTQSKYLFLPLGFDFADPQANLPALVDRWNAADPHTVLVMADPDSAFQQLATQPLPELSPDLNPIWQAFYDTRPAAKIADKESEYFLTAADKFGLLSGASSSSAWNNAAFNAHYDNIGGVSFDSVWQNSQWPRYTKTLDTAQSDLASSLAQIASRVSAPIIVFNPTSWRRSGVIELSGDVPNTDGLPSPVQHIGTNTVAFYANDVPAIGYKGLSSGSVTIEHPASLVQDSSHVTLRNDLVAVTIDGDHGGVFSSLALYTDGTASHELLSALGDDVVYRADRGDVYGASFGQVLARESAVPARLTVLAGGPLLARVQAVFVLGGQQIIKTVTVRAGDPLVEVNLAISVLPDSTALVETPTILTTNIRTDDLGFGVFTHLIDPQPIASGDVTYRRKIFYPITYWSDVSTANGSLTLITHGLQGVAGGATRSFMLVRQVTNDEGLTDPGVHQLSYAYLPHGGSAADAQVWLAAYAFNQPLIPTWRVDNQIAVQLPFDATKLARQISPGAVGTPLPDSFSLLSAQDAIVADLYRQDNQVEAVVINYQPTLVGTLHVGGQTVPVGRGVLNFVPISLPNR